MAHAFPAAIDFGFNHVVCLRGVCDDMGMRVATVHQYDRFAHVRLSSDAMARLDHVVGIILQDSLEALRLGNVVVILDSEGRTMGLLQPGDEDYCEVR